MSYRFNSFPPIHSSFPILPTASAGKMAIADDKYLSTTSSGFWFLSQAAEHA
jgi:hypothetical protein